MFKLRKCIRLRKSKGHFEFDGSNMSQKNWERVMFTTV